MAKSLKDMFEARYVPEPNSGCWLWFGPVNEHGYGTLRNKYAHRVSYELHRGEVGALCVLHKCDVPACVNPDHLFLGTRADNIRDCHSKGRMFVQTKKHRMARGERVYGSKLTPEKVIEIRRRYAAGEQQIPLARIFGVTQGAIHSIVAGKTWKHVALVSPSGMWTE